MRIKNWAEKLSLIIIIGLTNLVLIMFFLLRSLSELDVSSPITKLEGTIKPTVASHFFKRAWSIICHFAMKYVISDSCLSSFVAFLAYPQILLIAQVVEKR